MRCDAVVAALTEGRSAVAAILRSIVRVLNTFGAGLIFRMFEGTALVRLWWLFATLFVLLALFVGRDLGVRTTAELRPAQNPTAQ